MNLQAQSQGRISREQLHKLVKDSKMTSDELARRVYASGVDFTLSSDDEAKLLELGVEVKVLLAVALSSKGVVAPRRTESLAAAPGGIKSEAPPEPASAERLAPSQSGGLPKPANIQPPQVLRSTPPKYPIGALAGKVAGSVPVDVVIGADGKVESARAVSGHRWLTGPAEEAVRNWTFSPAMVNGTPSPAKTQVIVNFSLPKRD